MIKKVTIKAKVIVEMEIEDPKPGDITLSWYDGMNLQAIKSFVENNKFTKIEWINSYLNTEQEPTIIFKKGTE